MDLIFSDLFLRILEINAILAFFLIIFFREKLSKFLKRKTTISEKNHGFSHADIENAVRYAGYNTNSIYHLYNSIKHFRVKLKNESNANYPLLVGYQSQRTQNIVLTDPLCPPEHSKEVLKNFIRFSTHCKRETLFFAINEKTALTVRELGYKIIKIGQEPIFDLDIYDSTLINAKIRSSVRQVIKKGLVIEEYSAQELTSTGVLDQLEFVLHEWFSTRNADEFRGLTEVNPLEGSHDKKYFIARNGDAIEAFLVCSPIYARNGYFLHDLIRTPSAMNGISEALVLNALEVLKKQGYKMASLGISPLAGLDLQGVNSEFPRLNKILNFLYEKSTYPTRFKDLYHFKKKFSPTSEEGAYVAIPSSQIKLRYVIGFSKILMDLNILKSLYFKLKQWNLGQNIPRPLSALMDENKITLQPVTNLNFESIFYRFKFTITMFFLNIYTYFFTSNIGQNIESSTLNNYGFSFDQFVANKWFVLITSNFIHFNNAHLWGNMLMLILFCGVLEVIAGSRIAALVYLIGMQANIPTGFFILPIIRWIGHDLFIKTVTYVDVGASLGIMATFGGAIYFFKERVRNFLFIISIIITVGYTLIEMELIGLNHAFAIIFGYLVAKYLMGGNVSQEIFEQKNRTIFDRKKMKHKLSLINK